MEVTLGDVKAGDARVPGNEDTRQTPGGTTGWAKSEARETLRTGDGPEKGRGGKKSRKASGSGGELATDG